MKVGPFGLPACPSAEGNALALLSPRVVAASTQVHSNGCSPRTAANLKEVAMSSVVMTRTVTVNAAFLQEIKEVNQELWQRLEEMRHRCQRPIAPVNCRHLI